MDSYGVQYEGEEAPVADPLHRLAIEGFSMLANGMGGIDWAGLPMVSALLGVHDIEAFARHLMTIKAYRPETTDTTKDTDNASRDTLC